MPMEGTMELQTGEVDEFGHVRLGGIGNRLADEIEQRTGYEARMTALGHVLRGGSPTAYDRVIATRFGVEAIDAVHEGDFGVMVALRGTDVVRVPLEDGVAAAQDRRRHASSTPPPSSSAERRARGQHAGSIAARWARRSTI